MIDTYTSIQRITQYPISESFTMTHWQVNGI